MPRAKPKKKVEPKVEVAEKASEDTAEKARPPTRVHDFKIELPDTVELKVCEMHKVAGYDHIIKGRVWRHGEELVCVRLLDKHK